MIRTALVATALLFLVPVSMQAKPVTDAKLLAYVNRSLQICPGSKLAMETSNEVAPANFVAYKATQTSTESRCGKQMYVLVSPATSQTLIGDVFPIPSDGRPLDARINDLAGRMLQKQVRAAISPMPSSDGLRDVRIAIPTEYGPFGYGAYLDSSQRYLIVGRRGNLNVDAGQSLLEAIGISKAMRQGNRNAKIEIVELSDMQCPTCKRAHEIFEKKIGANLSRISFARLDLPLFQSHDWSLQAALAARAIQKLSPAHYWDFVDKVFDSQATMTRKAIDGFVEDFAETRNIDWKKLETLYRSTAEREALFLQTGKIYDSGIFVTPTFIVNGQTVFYGNDADYLKAHIDKLLGSGAKSPSPKKPAKKSARK